MSPRHQLYAGILEWQSLCFVLNKLPLSVKQDIQALQNDINLRFFFNYQDKQGLIPRSFLSRVHSKGGSLLIGGTWYLKTSSASTISSHDKISSSSDFVRPVLDAVM